MNYKKIANEGWESVSRYTSRDFNGPVPRRLRKEKIVRNRAAKRQEARLHIASQLDHDDVCSECGDPFPEEGSVCRECQMYAKYCSEPDYDVLDAFDDLAPEQDYELPDDYEECGDCGYDHAYEYPEAFSAHSV